jgi:hypothetical protein
VIELDRLTNLEVVDLTGVVGVAALGRRVRMPKSLRRCFLDGEEKERARARWVLGGGRCGGVEVFFDGGSFTDGQLCSTSSMW